MKNDWKGLTELQFYRWSFGGNRLQLKAEDKILGDVASALGDVAGIASHTHGPYKSLQAKQDLLHMFIENERSRLRVWLHPLEPERKHFIGPTSGGKNVADVCHTLPFSPLIISFEKFLTISVGSCVFAVARMGRKSRVSHSTCFSSSVRKVEERHSLAIDQLSGESS